MRVSMLLCLTVALSLLCVGLAQHESYVNEGEHLVHPPHSLHPHPTAAEALKLQRLHDAMKVDWRKSIYQGKDLKAHIQSPADDVPQQIKLSLIPKGMAVSWATVSASTNLVVSYGRSPNQLIWNTTADSPNSYGTLNFWTAFMTQLTSNAQYYYKIEGNPTVFSFYCPPHAGDLTPYTVSLVGDMGLSNSASTMARLNDGITYNTTTFYIHLGDLSYADDFILRPGDTYEGSWDKWQIEMQSVTANAAYMTLPGNHECTCTEVTPFLCPTQQRNFTAYRNRVRMPSAESGGVDNLWYSYDVGLAHFVHISTETDFPDAPMGPGTFYNAGPFGDQLAWLENDLQNAVAKRKDGSVPWIIVLGHRPLYSSHKVCVACQSAFEPLFLKYKVDVYFAGHVHWYERLWPIANGVVTQQNYVNPTGVVHLTNGAGGNVEGLNTDSKDTPWTAFLDDLDYGYGFLDVANSTAICWTYFRTWDNEPTDQIWITQEH